MEGNKTDKASNKKTLYYWFYGILFVSFIVFSAVMTVSQPNHTYKPSKTKSGSYSAATAASNKAIDITTFTEQRGDYLVVTVKAKNNAGYSVDKKLNVYVVDSTGVKRHIDIIYVQLDAEETGHSESSKKISDLGPPPYQVTTEWK